MTEERERGAMKQTKQMMLSFKKKEINSNMDINIADFR